MQCAAVRIARGEITVPEHAPAGELKLSRMLRRTTAEAPVGQSVPLRMARDEDALDPSTPHAPPDGNPGEGLGVVGVVGVPPPPPPPQAIVTAKQRSKASEPGRFITVLRVR
jgi:hypothetical protein